MPFRSALQARPALQAFVVLAIAVILFPLVFTGRFEIGAAVTVGAMSISATGFVLLIGYAQQLALGHAAFCLVGGYASAILTVRYGWDPLAALVAAAAVSMACAYVLGKPILKLRGFILAMASLALQLILVFVALEAVAFTGGAEGIPGVPKFGAFGQPFESDRSLYYFVWLLVAISILIALNIERSGIGRALRAIAVSEAAAGAVGIDVTVHKVQMFVLSAGFASVTGSLTVHYLRIMEPHVFGFVFSLFLITAVIVGGLGSIWGGVLGAAAMVAVRESLRGLHLPQWEIVIMGALTVGVLLAFRRGVAGAIADLHARLAASPREPYADDARMLSQPLPVLAPRLAEGAPLVSVTGVSKSFGSLQAVQEASFAVEAGSVTALIGPNGAGKTTLFNLISGYLPLDHGEIRFAGRRIDAMLPHEIARLGVGRTFQNLQLFDNMSAIENVMSGCHARVRQGLANVTLRLPAVARQERAIRDTAHHWLRFVGLEGVANSSPGALPFGHQRKLEIARALAASPALILMDEPASGLNDTETENLAELILDIRAQGISLLIVEHDMRLVMGLADRIVVMNHGLVIAQGTADEVRSDPDVISAYLGGTDERSAGRA